MRQTTPTHSVDFRRLMALTTAKAAYALQCYYWSGEFSPSRAKVDRETMYYNWAGAFPPHTYKTSWLKTPSQKTTDLS